ncbi:MAG: DnaA regulatory inactivator Hda [Gammaproteobacteria bacterium]
MNTISSFTGQIPLALDPQHQPGFDLFVAGANAAVCEKVKKIASGNLASNLYLWGATGTGVTHLLQAACRQAAEQGRQSAYIPLGAHADLAPGMLENMEAPDLVCMDDIDQIGGVQEWEQALLHLYNRRRDLVQPMLIGAHTSPQNLNFSLPDLKSRMTWDLVYLLRVLSDADKIELLQRRAAARSFSLPRDVAEYLVKRVRRDLPHLVNIMSQLEQATLVEQRKLTIPFVKLLLQLE